VCTNKICKKCSEKVGGTLLEEKLSETLSSEIEVIKQGEETVSEKVKFSSQEHENKIKCQGNDDEGQADIQRKGEQKDIQLGENPGKDAENQTGKEQHCKNRGAKHDPQGEHMAYQFHQVGNGIAGEVELSGWEQFIRAYGYPQKQMVDVEGEKNEDGKDILKLGEEGDLPLSLGIEDIGGGKTHLVANDRSAEFYRGEDETGDKTDEGAQEGLIDDQQQKGHGRKADLGQGFFHDRKEDQRDGKDQAGLDPGRGLGPGDNRDGPDKTCYPGGYNEEILELFDGNELDVHRELEGGHGVKETYREH